jgi:aspartyl-tRNA synthetase
MTRTYIKDLKDYTGKEVTIFGWVNVRRDQGKMVFIDMRDMSGVVQCVVLPNHQEAMEKANRVRTEWVLEMKGVVNKRPEKNANLKVQNGDIELEITSITVLNEAETPNFDVTTNGKEVGEDSRLTYRYLDLRRERLQKNIRNRHKIASVIRNKLSEQSFTEIETPMLTKSTPEGARDYVVPSRLHTGMFYALPQSPQQYKQLLMASGFEKYFQIARCMRDEDTRGDRQPEFTQLDLEMSFATEDDVMNVTEKLLIDIVADLYPEKKIQEIPFPKIAYKDAVEKYGNDRPDLRKDKENPNLLAFCWIVDFPFFEKTSKSDNANAEGEWTFTHNPFSSPKIEFMDNLMEKKKIGEIIAAQYDITLNGFEIGGGSIRNHKPEALKKVFEIIGHSEENINKNFGHMLKALGSGTPPHGGIAWGFDRLVMVLQNEENIREVIAFPKTGEGKDLMMDAPSQISEKQLKDLHIDIRKK